METDKMKPYNEFLQEKAIIHKAKGFEVNKEEISPVLFPHQNAKCRYVLRKASAATLMDTGLGKTPVELEYARLVTKYTGKPVLIIMPLWVAYQTIDMAKELFDRDITFANDRMDIAPGSNIYVTNYEKLHKFYDIDFGGLVFDESSIFKASGKYFQRAKKLVKDVDFVLCASATPAPNSPEEIGRQSEVIKAMTVEEMIATFFINRQDKKKIDKGKLLKAQVEKLSDGNVVASIPFTELMPENTGKKKERQDWVLKPHAEKDGPLNFYKWLASWAMAIKKPSDIGFSDEGYDLPPLTITPIFVDANYIPQDQLVFTGLKGISDTSQVRKLTLEPKCQMAMELIGDDTDQWIVWCGLNAESDRMAKLLKGRAVNVQGSDKTEVKIAGLRSFANNEIQVLISKTKICGHGSNFQNCHKAIFIGLNYSWESFYQAIKRIHRFKQTEPCEIYIILAEEEREIWNEVKRKGEKAELMTRELIKNADQYQKAELDMKASEKQEYVTDEIKTDKYHIMLGDSCERLAEIKNDSVGLSIYSPPFGNEIFVYSNIGNDLSNSTSIEEFLAHYAYIIKELYRVTMPGRNTVVHIADVHYKKNRNGRLGVYNFSDDVIKMYEKFGWHFYGRIPIAKNPQQAASRLKVDNLKFQTIDRDTARLMPIQPDYLLVFKKPGKNSVPILPRPRNELDNDKWIIWAGQSYVDADFASLGNISTEEDFVEYARSLWRERNSTIWYDIKESDVLKNHKGKDNLKVDENDTRHITPLQRKPVSRIIRLWSNPGEIVLTPFMGSGTEVYEAVLNGRYGIGIELKPEYFYELAVKNVEEAVRLSKQEDLFSLAGIEV